MPSKIQRSPPGVHGIFDTRGTGQLPNAFADEVRPVVELLDFYGAEVFSLEQDFDVAAVQGGTLQLVVPAGESWVIKNIEADFTMAAGTTAVALSINTAPTGTFGAIAAWKSFEAPFTTGRTKFLPYQPPTPLILRAGSDITATLQELGGAANGTLVLSSIFYRF